MHALAGACVHGPAGFRGQNGCCHSLYCSRCTNELALGQASVELCLPRFLATLLVPLQAPVADPAVGAAILALRPA